MFIVSFSTALNSIGRVRPSRSRALLRRCSLLLAVALGTTIYTRLSLAQDVRSQDVASQAPKSAPKKSVRATSTPESGASHVTGATRKQTSAVGRRPYQEPVEQTLRRLDDSQMNLKIYAESYPRYADSLDMDTLESVMEGLSTETILAEIIRSIYSESLRQGWRMTDRYNIFPIHESALNSQIRGQLKFNPHGARVAILGLRMGARNRGIILTAHYQPTLPGELERQFRANVIHETVMSARETYNAHAAELINRMKSNNPRLSEYLPVTGIANSWVLGCETLISQKFCINARVFDANDTRTDIFYDALMGHTEPDERLRQIRSTKLGWPVSNSYISRGYKFECSGCERNHYGLDLAIPRGTPILAIQSGQVLKIANLTGWGRTVVLEHKLPNGDSYVSLYAHLTKPLKGLKVGQFVERGEVIAESGNTGSSRGPHLHLEIRYAPNGREPVETLRHPRSKIERPLDPLRVLDIFNVFVNGRE